MLPLKERRPARHRVEGGRTALEIVKVAYLRRAAPIPLTGGCISCHEGFFKEPSKAAKFAGLVDQRADCRRTGRQVAPTDRLANCLLTQLGP